MVKGEHFNQYQSNGFHVRMHLTDFILKLQALTSGRLYDKEFCYFKNAGGVWSDVINIGTRVQASSSGAMNASIKFHGNVSNSC